MNYIIWNGEDSRKISGLLICELPSITKPKMRTQITEIEGKDGDFCDNIGYSAYDKTLSIGLYGKYDVDAVAKYFTGSGQIIFSNEPDKYYNAEISEQIEFEKLINFKTATVKFHTQPFKYLVNEEAKTFEISGETNVEVTNLGLENSKPIITLWGTGIVEILINEIRNFKIHLEGVNQPITIDSNIEECYSESILVLKNRSMSGDFPTLNSGKNKISWSGNLTKIKINPMSRWL